MECLNAMTYQSSVTSLKHLCCGGDRNTYTSASRKEDGSTSVAFWVCWEKWLWVVSGTSKLRAQVTQGRAMCVFGSPQYTDCVEIRVLCEKPWEKTEAPYAQYFKVLHALRWFQTTKWLGKMAKKTGRKRRETGTFGGQERTMNTILIYPVLTSL